MQKDDQKFTPRQKEILQVALHILAEEGTGALTMKRVAQHIGFTEAAVYRHFENKRSMLSALYSFVKEGLLERLSPILILDSPPEDRIKAFVNQSIDYLVTNKGVNLVLLAETIQRKDPVLRKAMLVIFNTFKSLVQVLLQTGIASGQFRPGIDTEVYATCLAGMIQGALTRHVLEIPGTKSFNIFDSKELIAECFLGGVALRPSCERSFLDGK
jgi:AcrR family transcriptional regulator